MTRLRAAWSYVGSPGRTQRLRPTVFIVPGDSRHADWREARMLRRSSEVTPIAHQRGDHWYWAEQLPTGEHGQSATWVRVPRSIERIFQRLGSIGAAE